jgi:hypothetical protein
MPEITHLPSQRRKRYKTHYALRGSPEIGYSWWLMHEDVDIPPALVGKEEFLPKHAYDFLQRMRAEPKVGERRKARYIDAHLHFFPGQDHNGIPHDQNVDWLRQYHRLSVGEGSYSVEKAYLVVLVGPINEDYPLQIWESRRSAKYPDGNHLDAVYTLVWKREEDAE